MSNRCCNGPSSGEVGAMASLTESIQDPFKRRYKVVVVGEAGVGKTSVIDRMVGFPFEANPMPTIGIEFKIETIKIADMEIKVQMWDSAGQERFRTLTTTYFHNADMVLFVYDVTQKSTFDDLLNYWISNAQEKCRKKTYLKVLIGNKTDLLQPNEDEPVPKELIQALTMLPGWTYARTSAKAQSKEVLKRVFSTIVDRLLQGDPTIDFEALMKHDSQMRSTQLLVDESWANEESSDDLPQLLLPTHNDNS